MRMAQIAEHVVHLSNCYKQFQKIADNEGL